MRSKYREFLKIEYMSCGSLSEIDNIWYVDCNICNESIFNGHRLRNWDTSNTEQKERKFHNAIRYHFSTRHPELIYNRKTKKVIVDHKIKLKKDVNKMALDLLTDNIILIGGQCRTAEEYNEYYCLLCGKSQYKENRLSHIESIHEEWVNAFWVVEKIEKYVRKRRTYPLKPWRDPESLFCSPNLKYIINKEPLQGDECRESSRSKQRRLED
jgi:hypothetical protein